MSGSVVSPDMTPDELRAARKVLVQARLSGTLSVATADGTRVQYRGDAELAAQIGYVDRLLSGMAADPAADPSTQPVRAFRLRPWNGYY